jgi:tetratricopeptide (TPR) repeat protein
MPRWASRLVFFLACAMPAGSAEAQDWKGTGRLEGKAVDEQGHPIPDVVVNLELQSRGSTTVKTDKKGKWVLGGVAAGTWNIDFEAPGYVAKKVSVSLPAESSRLPPIQVTLQKAGPQGPPPEVLEAIKKGDEAYKAGRYPEARQEYERLLTLRPDLALTLHEQIARCYNQEGNYEKELEHLQHLLDADPASVQLKALMAQEALKGGMLERGMALLRQIDETTIKDPNVFFNIAVLFLNQQKGEQAIPYLTKAVALDPTYVDGYFQRGLAYLGLQKNAEAKADFTKVLELAAPGSAQAVTAQKALEQIK